MPNQLALYQVTTMMTRTKTYNEYVFESFDKSFENQTKGGEKDVKLNRIKEKLWCGRSQLPS